MTATSISSLTQERLKARLRYEPDSGIFYWLDGHRRGRQAGTTRNGYVAIKIDRIGQPIGAHRLAWLYMTGTWPKQHIDHRDLNGCNNRWENLREATPSQNHANAKPRKNAHGLKGVVKHQGKYYAKISINGHSKWLGSFSTPEAAHAAYSDAAKAAYGEFARPS